jgi:hypothetical protein
VITQEEFEAIVTVDPLKWTDDMINDVEELNPSLAREVREAQARQAQEE